MWVGWGYRDGYAATAATRSPTTNTSVCHLFCSIHPPTRFRPPSFLPLPQEIAKAVVRRQMKHVMFTDPEVIQAGQRVTVYYNPSDTILAGSRWAMDCMNVCVSKRFFFHVYVCW